MILTGLPEHIQADVNAINNISLVPSLLDVVCRSTGMGFAAIARVTDDKWVACAVRDDISFGLMAGGELPLDSTICNEIRQHQQAVIIDHVAEDPFFSQHHTPLQYGFQSYISYPIFRKNGSFFGTLCAIDPRPAKLNNPQMIGMFNLFADLISLHLDANEKLLISETKLSEELKISEVREQFLAILGHDLKNPLSSVLLGAEILSESKLDENSREVLQTIKRSSKRMSSLVDNILDFARGKLGGGIQLSPENTNSLQETLAQVIAELQTSWPDRVISFTYENGSPLYCDTARLAQLFSNLIGNALTHGKPETPVTVVASQKEGFHFSVTNQGFAVPPTVLDHIFQPFYRGDDTSGKSGLGLGLYIAHEIAKAHGGELKASSTEEKTCFSFSIPPA